MVALLRSECSKATMLHSRSPPGARPEPASAGPVEPVGTG
jgi:hypothetical protein